MESSKSIGSGYDIAHEKNQKRMELLAKLRAFESAVCQTIRSLEEDQMELKEIKSEPFNPILLEEYMEGVKSQLDLVRGTILEGSLELQIEPTIDAGLHHELIGCEIMALEEFRFGQNEQSICEIMVGDPFLSTGSQIQPFDGNPSVSFTRWSQKFEDILSLFTTRLSEQQKISRLKFCLEGQARAELDSIEPNSLEEAIAHLKSKFENDNTKSIARQKLSSCKQMPSEKVFEFANRLNEAVRTALAGEEENIIRKRLLEEFMDRLLPDLQYEVKAQRPNEYSKAYEIAQQYELLAHLKRPSYASAQVAELDERFEAMAIQKRQNMNSARGKCFNCGWGPPAFPVADPAEIAEASSSSGIQRQPRDRRQDRFEPLDFQHESWPPMDTSQDRWLNGRWEF